MSNENLNNFRNLVSDEKSTWLEEAKARQKNRAWLKHSQKIAIKLLSTLRENKKNKVGITNQKQLAEVLGVSPQQINKIVKGSENLTLETISKLEQALKVELIFERAS
jgi:antitoxin component HigA of HigAB toxin-antitoxin module